MQLNVSVGGSIAAAPSPARSAAVGAEAASLLSPAEPVPGVTVALSPVAEAMLDGHDAARDEGGGPRPGVIPATDPTHNPLGGAALDESLHAAYDDDSPKEDPNALSMDALTEAIRHEKADREHSLRTLRRAKHGAPNELSEAEQRVVDELRARDAEVRAHEMAHVAAAGGLAGAPSFSYQTGPDGKRYAIGGSVSIDTSAGSSPEETISRAQRIRAASTAPADPSAQDRAVAARASQMEQHARAQLSMERRMEQEQAMQPEDDASLSGAPAVELDEGGVPVARLPRLRIDPRDTPQAPITSGLAVLGTPAKSARLAAFTGGSAADAQLYSPPERSLEATYIDAARGQRAS